MAATDTTLPPAPAYLLPGVELFASGTYRGKRWDAATVRRMAETAKKLGPSGLKLLVPPAVLGHEEEQEWLERTDLPAGGWVDPDTVRVKPDPRHPGELILVGDVLNVPPEVAARVKAREFGRCSIEVYDDFQDDFGRRHGKAIRRLALLGGEVPQVKRLAPLPDPVPMAAVRQFAERPGLWVAARRDAGGRLIGFAEALPVDRTQMIAAVQAAMPGVARATLDALNDDQLADLAKNVPTPTAQPAPAAFQEPTMTREELIAALTEMGEDPTALAAMDDAALQALYDEKSAATAAPPEGVTQMGDPAAMTREELIAELVAAGQDQAALEAMTDDELRAAYAALSAEPVAAAPAATPMSDRGRRTAPAALPALRKLAANAAKLNAFAESQLRRANQINRELKAKKIAAFGEEMVKAGRFLPWHRDEFCRLLMSLDDTKATHRFSENGRTTLKTPLDLVLDRCRKGAPVVRFGERLPADDLSPEEQGAAELARVKRFAREKLPEKAAGQYVAKFSELQKKRPSFTAQEYGVDPVYCV